MGFSEADDQPPCDNSAPVDDDVGLSFQLYKWQISEAFTCKLTGPACEFNCNIFGGKFNTDDGNCYEFKALKKLCVKVDFKYYDDQPAAEALYVSDVRVTNGCFIQGAVGMYEQEQPSQMPDGSYEYFFNDVSVEVRHDFDPYTVFTALEPTETADLSIFFWLSMGSLLVALFLIFFLGFYYQCYISNE